MHLLKINNFKIISIIFFLVVLIFGLLLFKDYGVSLDEDFHKSNASYWQKYVKSFITNRDSSIISNHEILIKKNIDSGNDLTSSIPSIQPVPLGIIYEFFASFLNLENSKEKYQSRHLFNFLIFFVGLLFFYQIIYKRYDSYLYALLGCIFLFLTPRIFSESFYNPQDIFFLALTIINMYTGINFLKKPNLKNTILFSISSALSIDTRIMGFISFSLILFFYFLKLLRSRIFLREGLKYIYFVIPFTFFFVILFWPFLWNNTINNFIFSLSKLSSASFLVTNLYLGEYISSINVPWHYHLVWIFITTPIIIMILFVFGFLFLLKRLFSRFLKLNEEYNDVWRGENEMLDLYFLAMIVVPILLLIKGGMGYDGWRHLYFIYPSIILTSLYFFHYLHLLKKIRFFKSFIYLLIILNLSYLVYWNIKYHPHQNVYFNLFFKKTFHKNFDLDYWGLSNKASLKYILENNTKYPIKVATKSFSALERNLLILDETDKDKISILYNLDKADFIITNYRKRIKNDFFIDKDKYKKYYEILIDGVPINTVYKKII